MTYDRADWHYGGEYPADLPPENGSTQIGMFLAWAIMRGLQGTFHDKNSVPELAAVRGREMTGGEFLRQMCDEKFTEMDLNDEGNAFARDYYITDKGVNYFADYRDTLGRDLPSQYHVEDSWENFDKLAPVLDARLEEWRGQRRK
jgi:hypothetical protein